MNPVCVRVCVCVKGGGQNLTKTINVLERSLNDSSNSIDINYVYMERKWLLTNL